MEAAESRIAWCAHGRGQILGRRGNLRLGCGVGGNGGCAKTGESEGNDESADDVVLHDVLLLLILFLVFQNFSLDKPTGYNIRCNVGASL